MKEYKSNLDQVSLVKIKSDIKRAKIQSSVDINKYVRNFYFEDLEIFESMFVVMLNNANNTVGYAKISQGGITGTLVDVRILCNYVINCLACGVIIVHNHPSGTLRPSEADKLITKKVKNALKLFDVKLLDHLIITKNSYYSFADEGIL